MVSMGLCGTNTNYIWTKRRNELKNEVSSTSGFVHFHTALSSEVCSPTEKKMFFLCGLSEVMKVSLIFILGKAIFLNGVPLMVP